MALPDNSATPLCGYTRLSLLLSPVLIQNPETRALVFAMQLQLH